MGRYQYQAWEIEVPFELPQSGLLADGDIGGLLKAFHAMHQRIYGICDEQNLVEFVSWKMTAVGKTNAKPASEPPAEARTATAPKPKTTRHVYLGPETKRVELPVYAGGDIRADHTIEGPAIIEEETMTLLFLPGMTVRADADGNYWVKSD